jgi:hypothetical protein
MNILSENEDFCAQAPKKEAPCIPIAEARGFTARNDKFRADKGKFVLFVTSKLHFHRLSLKWVLRGNLSGSKLGSFASKLSS